MDAAEDASDIKIYRVASERLPELQIKLPGLVWHLRTGQRNGRLQVIHAKTEELVALLEPFQEWPQLLDSHLSAFLQTLCDAFLSYVTTKADNYFKPPSSTSISTVPLPRAVCRLLYQFCKVRGQKVVVRFFNNEPKYIEPILDCLRQWSSMNNADPTNSMTWEERYIMLLWLSHLMLAPFDLASISSTSIDVSESSLASVLVGLPSVAQTLFQTAFDYLHVSSKEREAAAIMIVRLVLRGDMQARQLLPKVIDLALTGLRQGDDKNVSAAAAAYRFSGLLSLLCGIMTVGSDSDVAPHLHKIFQVCIKLATQNGPHETHVRNTAPVRKSLAKAVRLSVVHALSLTARQPDMAVVYDLETMLEETIQYLLESLSDKDTPVRMIASKSLSIIALSLEPAMSAEVVQAVLDSLDENMLLDDSDRRTFPITEISPDRVKNHKKNASAVNPLQWHGLMLTLSHLLFRRSPPPRQLPEIIAALIAGLEFEQRSNVGTSVGVGVRDAACFGVWSLARKYSTTEIDMVDAAQLLSVLDEASQTLAISHSTLQVLANQLVLSACLDPSGNIRRGASAALQELVGRHPDMILHGISVVQVVDYHAVARRSRAMIEVSLQASELDAVYLDSLFVALLRWRGMRSADAESRRWAAEAINGLTGISSFGSAIAQCARLEVQASKIRASNAGSNASSRHGMLLGLSAMLQKIWEQRDNLPKSDELLSAVLHSTLRDLDLLIGTISGRVTRDLELVFEATSALVAILAETCTVTEKDNLLKLLPVVERCLTASEKDAVVLESMDAFKILFSHMDHPAQASLLDSWLRTDHSTRSEYRSRGRIEAVGAIFSIMSLEPSKTSCAARSKALNYLEEFLLHERWPIETKTYAMDSLKNMLLASTEPDEQGHMRLFVEEIDSIAAVILIGLNDYTIDQRGDIGSTLRLKAIKAAQAFLCVVGAKSHSVKSIFQAVARLAAEKLDKLRLQAWLLLQSFWKQRPEFPLLKKEFTYLADVSSVRYYLQLLELLGIEWLYRPVIAGFVSSAAAGTDEIGRSSRNALIEYMLNRTKQIPKLSADAIICCIVEHVDTNIADDRETIPAMETIAFILEQQLKTDAVTSQRVSDLMKKAHTTTSSIQRHEVAVKAYSALCNTDQTKVALDKLTRMLLHRYPKVRGEAADTLHLQTSDKGIVTVDWTTPVAELKPIVLKLRKDLKVV